MINTFLRQCDLSNKKIVLFLTSAIICMGNTAEKLRSYLGTSDYVANAQFMNDIPDIDTLKK